MAPAFDTTPDRRFAARELSRALGSDSGAALLSNVGAIARLQVPVTAVEGSRGLTVYAGRLREARARAAVSKEPAPTTLPLFTPADITLLKPGLVVRTRGAHTRAVLWCALLLLAGFQVVSLVWQWRGITGDRVLLAAAQLLTTFGALVMIARPDPLRDTLLLSRYTGGVLVGTLACAGCSMVRIRTSGLLQLKYLALAAAVVLSVALMVFGSGPGTSGAKVNLGPAQPVEFIRLLLAFFLAGYLGHRWELIRHVQEHEWRGRRLPTWLRIPRLDHMIPVLGAVAVALLLFFVLRDLGPALLLSLMFVAMLAVARAGSTEIVLGVIMLGGGYYAGYALGLSSTLATRVAMWKSPWENAIRGGDQVAQALWGLAAGGATGTGLGLGDTRYLPAGHTDLVLAAVGEELGLVGLVLVAGAAVVIAWRGLRIARAAPTDTAFFLALALTLTLVVPMLVMGAGLLGLMPLTGVVTPFVSYGGSAMLANFAALGLLAAIASDPSTPVESTAFKQPVRWLAGVLAVAAGVLLVVCARVQIVNADAVLVRPQLSLQADGGRRYQYNPRVLDAARTLPRGNIFDRRGVPLAADVAVASAASAELSRLGLSLHDVCPDTTRRCYPLRGQTFHLLGDANTRTNWAASNTSYLERDAEDGLRGFDSRATAVRTQDDDGVPTLALRRDYRDLVPLVRHRWEPSNESVKRIRERGRDSRLTIDARLQTQVSSLLARTIAAAGIQHGTVVVLDADTGELLASVSYPWPTFDAGTAEGPADALLDRARYGLYPPGSTFKLVTAAAALRLDPGLSRVPFTCSRLVGDRVGAKIPGWSRPIHDDVMDRTPHGTLTMRDAMVHSCNAYFAQLAVRLGTEPLARTAGLAGLVFPTGGSAARQHDALPHEGYGQGDVLATPLRMARVAAAIASDGGIREPPLVRQTEPVAPRPFLPSDSARLLAGYMRDVVTDGTGRSLRTHAIHIAGKTGTAEVDDGASHGWFVGFAPAGPATHRVAFAIVLEHAGYGGGAPAELAGRIVTAAAALGLVK
ncbi:MAG: FtsW/RodA/SpoVE family cell cycle protein [Vicinamibacterales bacterium]